MDELLKLGYALSFSEACPVTAWGTWHCSFKHTNGAYVKGYGATEQDAVKEALDRVLKTMLIIEQNKDLQSH